MFRVCLIWRVCFQSRHLETSLYRHLQHFLCISCIQVFAICIPCLTHVARSRPNVDTIFPGTALPEPWNEFKALRAKWNTHLTSCSTSTESIELAQLLQLVEFASVRFFNLYWLTAELWSVSVARVETCGQALLSIHIVASCTLESLELLSPWKPWTIAAIWTIGTIASITQFDTVLSLARAPWAWVSWAQVTTWFAGSCLQVAHAGDCPGGKKSSQTFRWFGITAHISDQLIHLTVISEQRYSSNVGQHLPTHSTAKEKRSSMHWYRNLGVKCWMEGFSATNSSANAPT